jgi:hypothetical protein
MAPFLSEGLSIRVVSNRCIFLVHRPGLIPSQFCYLYNPSVKISKKKGNRFTGDLLFSYDSVQFIP